MPIIESERPFGPNTSSTVEKTTGTLGARGLFNNYNFRILTLISLNNGLGEKYLFMLTVLLAAPLVPPHLQNSMMSGLSLAFAIPAIFLGSLTGILVDRFPLKTMLAVSNLSRVLLLLTLPFAEHSYISLLIFALAFGSLTQLYNPTCMTLVPVVTHKEDLMSANAIMTAIMILTVIGGMGMAKPISDTLGIHYAYLVVGGIYLIAAIATFGLKVPAHGEEREKTNFWDEWKAAIAYLYRTPALIRIYAMMMSMFGVFAALNVLAKEYALDTFNLANFGLISVFAGAGMAAGAGLMGRFGKKLPKTTWVRIGFVISSLSLLVLPFLNDLRIAFGLCFAIGISGAMIDIPLATMVQETVEPSMRSKIFGIQGTLNYIASLVPMIIVGPLADLLSASTMIAVLGALLGIIGLSCLRNISIFNPAP